MPSKTRHARESRSNPAVVPEEMPQPLWALAWSEAEGVRTLSRPEEIKAAYSRPDTLLWVDLEDPDRDLLLALSDVFKLHPLVTEDILERNQRGKIEVTGDAVHIVMFALSYVGETLSHEIDIVIGERFLLTGHEADVSLRDAPFMRRDPRGKLHGGVDYTLWAISDWVVDGYFPVFDRLSDEIGELEDDVMRRPSRWIVERLFQVRRELLTIRRAVNPQREIFNQLTNRDLPQIQPDRIVYFRDVYDHLIRLTDELDSYRELVSTALDIYLSQVNNNLSEIMKRLTAVTAVLAGAGALAGIFGMSEVGLAISFQDPRFWVVAALIGLAAVLGFAYFRRIGWI
jgi:magnesium transporter